MHFAFWLLATKCSNRKEKGSYNVNSRTYQLLKKQHSIEVSKVHTGKVRSEETRRKASISLKGKVPWNKDRKNIYSEETIRKMSTARMGFVESIETREKKSLAHIGIKRGPSSLRGIPAPIDEKYIVKCLHCNKEGTKWNMKRYHFDNCKNKGK